MSSSRFHLPRPLASSHIPACLAPSSRVAASHGSRSLARPVRSASARSASAHPAPAHRAAPLSPTVTLSLAVFLLASALPPALLAAAPNAAAVPVDATRDPTAAPQHSEGLGFDPALLSGLRFRSIGPAGMSGRVAAIDAWVPEGTDRSPRLIYVGAATGGVWKSTDGGTTFQPVFDDQPVASIGALAIDRRSPDTVWVGTGEGNPRNSVSIGRGVFRTTDGARTWQWKGLAETERIHRVILHPHDKDTVWICAMGQAWSPNPERGVYRTRDGGASWEHVLAVDENTGCADLVVHPENPETLLAAMWQYRRFPHFFRSGGPSSGLFRTSDGGDSWTRLTDLEGLPRSSSGGTADLGRIGVAFAPSEPTVAYALVEAQANALLRSEDAGRTWRTVNSDAQVSPRPFYFADIRVDPERPDRVYRLASSLDVSTDGGRSFQTLAGFTDLHPDHHELWIHPRDGSYLISGNDGGVGISRDRGATWDFVRNLPLAQYYHVRVDDDLPYNVYGGLQDNGSWKGPSAVWEQGFGGGIRNFHWTMVAFGDGFDTAPDPEDSSRGYAMSQGGNLSRWDIPNGGGKAIRPDTPEELWEEDEELRFNWNAGFGQDPDDPATIYYGSQYLHRSTDRGESWQIVSPDLTTDNAEWQLQKQSGGLTYDVTAAENYTTIIAVAPTDEGVLWVGTDDGRVWVGRKREGDDTSTSEHDGESDPSAGDHDGESDTSASSPFRGRTEVGVSQSSGSSQVRHPREGGDPRAPGSGNDPVSDTSASSPFRGRTEEGVSQEAAAYLYTWTSVEQNAYAAGVPQNAWVPHITPSRHHPSEAFVVFDDHRRGDMRPYAFRVSDYGATWTPLVDPDGPLARAMGYALKLEQDPVEEDLLFLGTEFGLWITLDGGQRWFKHTHGVPTVSVMDIAIQERESDLVLGTHGRGIYVLDDLGPLRELARGSEAREALAAISTSGPADDANQSPPPSGGGQGWGSTNTADTSLETGRIHLYEIPAAQQYQAGNSPGELMPGSTEYRGENQPYGAQITFLLDAPGLPYPDQDVERAQRESARAERMAREEWATYGEGEGAAEVASGSNRRDGDTGGRGGASRSDASAETSPKAKVEIYATAESPIGEEGEVLRTFEGPVHRGLNRITWNLESDPFDRPGGNQGGGFFGGGGPQVVPGEYGVRVSLSSASQQSTEHGSAQDSDPSASASPSVIPPSVIPAEAGIHAFQSSATSQGSAAPQSSQETTPSQPGTANQTNPNQVTAETTFTVLADPRLGISLEDRIANWDAVQRVGALQERLADCVKEIQQEREDLEYWAKVDAREEERESGEAEGGAEEERRVETEEDRDRAASPSGRLSPEERKQRFEELREEEERIWTPPGTKGIPSRTRLLDEVGRVLRALQSDWGKPGESVTREVERVELEASLTVGASRDRP
ncbi:MAG: hypothetical protein DWQ36_23230 [Acidobacteria bacterium]|nr:MAG: hypothetical protein DWQ30_19510 [Acidobacteriota bacterium]REK00328.1 MAG: hypothetical protein DWQ36_23230 [Acidobacteriota bacterium]